MTDQLQDVLKIAHIGLWQWEVNSNAVVWDEQKFRLLGFEPNEFEMSMENAFKTVHPEDHSKIYKILEEHLPNRDFFDYEYRGIKKSGELIYLWTSLHVYRDNTGKAIRVKGITQDITQRKILENKIIELNNNLEVDVKNRMEDLAKKNRENEILVKEMHHRVKNNLQVISSMLSLQKGHVQDTDSKMILEQSISRIKSMALIHESLYSKNNLSEIKLNEYVRNVFDMHIQGNDNPIQIHIEIPNYVLPVNKMVPLGLIINELVSNSMTHAFPHELKGEITIKIEIKDNFTLVYSDNGKGMREDQYRKKITFGMELIETLCEDLHAKYSFTNGNSNGMKFEFESSEL